MRKRLSKLTLEQRAPTKGRIEIRDSESPLVFRLTSNGVRTLTVRTRFKGQQVRFTYPHAARTENWKTRGSGRTRCLISAKQALIRRRRTQGAARR